jgi:Family of unknown function (DUF5985)
MLEFLAGAVTFAYAIAAMHFYHFWKRTTDRLFLAFALAFVLLALNQFAVFAIEANDERGNFAYVLRVLAFVIILFAIVDKNTFARRRER